MKSRSKTVWLAFALGVVATTGALAQSFPTRPIRMVVPYSAGGGLDMMCRTVAERMAQAVRQPVVVDNRVGASGTIGTAAVAKSAPDGHTIHCGTNSEITLAPFVLKDVPYDAERELVPLTMGVRQVVLLVAHPSLDAPDLRTLLERTRAQRASYAHLGVGHSFHLAMAMLSAEANAPFEGVPYKGAANSVTDVLGGHIKLAMLNLAPVHQHLRDGRLKALAVFQPERSAALPDVPTVREIVGADVQAPSWFGFFAPAGLPADVRARLEQELRAALADPAVRAKLAGATMEVMEMASAEFAEIVRRERASNEALVRRFGVRPE